MEHILRIRGTWIIHWVETLYEFIVTSLNEIVAKLLTYNWASQCDGFPRQAISYPIGIL